MFGKIASMFVDVDGSEEPKTEEAAAPEPEKKEAAPASAPAPAAAPSASTAPPTTPAPPPFVPATVNEEMVELLSSAIEAANLDGFDYIEFRNSLAAMASAPMPEKQKFQAVFATASTMGLTKQKLVDAIDHYQGVISNKKTEFDSHVEGMKAQEVTAREQLKEKKEQEIAALSEQIQQAQAAIAERQQEILNISNEINEQNLRIQQTSASFEATYNFVSGKLEEDKGKIQSYLAE